MALSNPIPEKLKNILSTNSGQTEVSKNATWAQNTRRHDIIHHAVRELQLTENQMIDAVAELLILVDSLESRIAALEAFHP